MIDKKKPDRYEIIGAMVGVMGAVYNILWTEIVLKTVLNGPDAVHDLLFLSLPPRTKIPDAIAKKCH